MHITAAVGLGTPWKKGTYSSHYSCYTGGPFENIVLTHYSCCWRPLWKQSTCTLQLALMGISKSEYLHITIAVEGAFNSSVFMHYSGCGGAPSKYRSSCGGPFKSRVLAHCRCCWGPLWKKSTCLRFALEYITVYEL